ncbi:MAG: hypothetical protein ACRDOI_29790 [Trebonia sp.]
MESAKGRLPWKPCPDAQDIHVWHQYEHPHVGTFTSNADTVVFTVLGGVETDVTVWAYACLTTGEAHGLDTIQFDSLTHLREFIDETFATRRLVLALADDLLITSWAVAEKIGPMYEVAADFLEQVLAQTRHQLDPGTRFRAELAEVDVATHKLIKALRTAERPRSRGIAAALAADRVRLGPLGAVALVTGSAPSAAGTWLREQWHRPLVTGW